MFFANNYFQEKNRLTQLKVTQDQMTAAAKAATEKDESDRKFAADQKDACLNVYKQESTKWNNTNGWRYDASEDTCYIEYKDSPKKTTAECDAKYKSDDGKVPSYFFSDYLLCKDGLFEKSF